MASYSHCASADPVSTNSSSSRSHAETNPAADPVPLPSAVARRPAQEAGTVLVRGESKKGASSDISGPKPSRPHSGVTSAADQAPVAGAAAPKPALVAGGDLARRELPMEVDSGNVALNISAAEEGALLAPDHRT